MAASWCSRLTPARGPGPRSIRPHRAAPSPASPAGAAKTTPALWPWPSRCKAAEASMVHPPAGQFWIAIVTTAGASKPGGSARKAG